MLDANYIETVERAAWQVARDKLGDDACRPSSLKRSIQRLSVAYTEFHAPSPLGEKQQAAPTRAHKPSLLPDRERLAAQLLFFTIADMPKPSFALRELAAIGRFDRHKPLRVLDLGAGCGAMSLGLLGMTEGSEKLHIVACDADAEALSLMQATFNQLAAAPLAADPFPGSQRALSLTTKQLALERSSALRELGAGYDLVLMGSFLAELDAKAAHNVVEHVTKRCLSPDGHVIIIEPALRDTARRLHELRDRLLDAKGYRLIAPCLTNGNCPALHNEGDWCHESHVWQMLPPRLRQLAADTGLRRRDIKYAYLSLARERGERQLVADVPLAALLAPDSANSKSPSIHSRVVSHCMRSKGKREVFVCSELGRIAAVRLDRHRSEANSGFERLSRGMLLSVPREAYLEAKGRIRIDDKTPIRICTPGDES